MGGASSTPSDKQTGQACEEWHKVMAANTGKPVLGGAIGKSGMSRAKALADPAMSAQRTEFVRNVARIFAKELGLKGINPDASLAEIVVAMREKVPDPRSREQGGNKTIYRADDESRSRAVRALSKAVNGALGKMGQSPAVDEKAPESDQVDVVMEKVGAAMPGIVEEFQLVHEPVKKSIKNLRKLQHWLDQNYNLLESKMAQADATGDSGLAAETGLIRSVHKELSEEIKRNLDMLEQLVTGTIDKVDTKVTLLSKENDEFKRLVRNIKAHAPGVKQAAKISYALAGLRGVAEAASEVDKALAALGVSKGEYERLKTSEDLDRKLDQIIAGKLHGSESSLRDYLKAVDKIRKNQWNHDAIAEVLKKGKSGAGEGSDSSSVAIVKHEGGKKLDKRVVERRNIRDKLLRVFVSEMGVGLNRFLQAVKGVAALTKSGNGLEITDSIDKFTRAFESLNIAKKYIYYALSGYDPSVNSRQEREQFLSNAQYITRIIGDIIKEGPKFHEHSTAPQKEAAKKAFVHFAGMRDGLDSMVKTVTQFSDKYATGFQNLLPMNPKKGSPAVGASESVDVIAEEYVGSADIPELTKLSVDFDNVKNELIYGVRLSKVRVNLLKSSEERSHYSEGYMKILPDAIAAAVDRETEKIQEFTNKYKEPEQLEAGKTDTLLVELFAVAPGASPLVKETDAAKLSAARLKLNSLLTFADAQYKARCTLYRTAEATDLYMKRFADGIAKEPDSVSNVVRAMEVTHMNAAWFTEKSGDALSYVFDSFPSWYSGDKAKFSHLTDSKNRTVGNHYYERVDQVCGLASGTGTGSKPADVVGRGRGLPGNPLLSTTVDKAKDIMKLTEGALAIGALKNIFSTFAVIGDKFAGKKLESESHMAAIEIYKNLLEYMAYSSYALGLTAAGGVAAISLPAELGIPSADLGGMPTGGSNTFQSATQINAGASDGGRVTGAERMWRVAGALTMRTVNTPVASKLYADLFSETDKIFIMIVKSVVVKVLTAIGVFNMFNRGVSQHGLGYSSGLRLYLGGATGMPKVLPEALEAYVRLPLLAEFYRTIFRFDELNTPGFRSISLVPEMDGIFSELIAIVFDKARYVEDGGYSETDVRLIIEAINKIYLQFKGRQNPNTEIFQEFAAEVNRRYGIYKREERIKYLEDRDARFFDKYRETEDLDVDVELPGLTEHVVPRPAPSMSFQTKGRNNATWKDHKYAINLDDQTMITEMRESIDNVFHHGMRQLAVGNADMQEPAEAMGQVKSGHISFEPMLRARKEELKYAKTDKDRYDIIVSAINSLGTFSVNALGKNLLMFHEAVAAPLNTLMGLFVMLKQFNSDIAVMNDVVKAARGFKAAFPANATAAMDALAGPGGLGTSGYRLKFAPQALPEVLEVVPGRQGYPAGSTAIAFSTLFTQAQALGGDKGAELLARFGVKQGALFMHLFEHLFAHGASLEKLVDMRLEVAKVKDGDAACAIALHLDHSKLHQFVADTFNAVKGAVDKFRGLVPKGLLDEFETYKSGQAGSLYYIEKEFIDTFLHGRTYEQDKSRADPGYVENRGFDSVVIKINEILKFLTQGWTVGGGALTGSGSGAPGAHEFDRELYQLVFYGTGAMSGLGAPASISKPEQARGLQKLIFNTTGKAKPGAGVDASWIGAFDVNSLMYDPNSGLMPGNTVRGVMMSFNRLLAAYVNQMYDEPSRKFYMTALNGFANGAFNKAILGKQTYDDSKFYVTNSFADVAENPSRANVKGVIFTSIAAAIKQLIMEPNHKGDKKEYVELDLAEIPIYVKERYRACLPAFDKYFHLLIKRAEMLKSMVNALNVAQSSDVVIGAFTLPKRDSKSNTQSLNFVLDEVIGGSNSLLQCIVDTQKDLADDPKYLETHAGSIAEYEGLNGRAPFMPPSSMLYALGNNDGVYDATRANQDRAMLAQPTAKLGENRFKFQFGTRGVFSHENVKLDEMPGMLEILREHNQSSDDKHHFSDKDISAILGGSLTLLRYLVTAKNLTQDLCAFSVEHVGVPTATEQLSHSNVDMVGVGSDLISPTERRTAYQLKPAHNLAEVITLTESNNKADQQRKIILGLEDNDDTCRLMGDRKAMLAYNIIDLNFMPINVHALQREIPLVNLYNAVYTFDKLIQEEFNLPEPYSRSGNPAQERGNMSSVDPRGAKGYGSKLPYEPEAYDAEPRSAKNLLGKMLIQPHMPVTMNTYMTLFSQVMRGDLGMDGLGQPKYLAQEVYNKALFGEIYPGSPYFTEADAGLGNAHLRGKEEVLGDMVPSLSADDVNNLVLLPMAIPYLLADGGKGLSILSSDSAAQTNDLKAVRDHLETVVRADAASVPGLIDAAMRSDSDLFKAFKVLDPSMVDGEIPLAIAVSVVATMLLNTPSVRGFVASTMAQVRVDPGRDESMIATRSLDVLIDGVVATLGKLVKWAPGELLPIAVSSGSPVTAIELADIRKLLPVSVTGARLAPVGLSHVSLAEPALKGRLLGYVARKMRKLRLPAASPPVINRASNPNYFPKELHYLAHNKSESDLKKVAVEVMKPYLMVLGKMRFDTVLARNVIWVANLQRALRLKLRKELIWYNEKVVSGYSMAAASVTELFDHRMHKQKTSLIQH